jgi:hypothetical protein
VRVAKRNVARRTVPKTHHALKKLSRFQLWIGEVTNAASPWNSLLAAEWAHTFGLRPRPALNVLKKNNPPASRVTVLNLWWRNEHDQRKRPHRKWPNRFDLIYRAAGHVDMHCWIGNHRLRFACRRHGGIWSVRQS